MEFNWLFERPIAHRGLHNDVYPENSMGAYQNAIEHNYNIEIDVHVTKDNVLVVHHDDSLKRICGVDKLIKECTYDEIKDLKLLNTEYKIPTFKEFIDMVDGKVGILCEIKGTWPFDFSIVKETIKECVGYKGKIALQSFNFGAVAYALKHCDLPVGELCTWAAPDFHTYRWWPCNFMGKLWVNYFTRPHFIAYDINATDPNYKENKYIVKWGKKLPTLFWIVNSEEKVKRAQKYVNNMIFEHLDLDLVEKTVGTFNDLPKKKK